MPITKVGCDSYASWDPKFKKFSNFYTVEEIANKIKSLLPDKQWYNPRNPIQDIHLVVTGGEPLLGWQEIYPELFDSLGCFNVTFETNGSQKLSTSFINYLNEAGLLATFSISPKLETSSGELKSVTQIRGVIDSFSQVISSVTSLKFVVDKNTNFAEIYDFLNFYNDEGFNGYIYLMPEGSTKENYIENSKFAAEEALKRGWCYSPRLQVDLWNNAWAT